MHGGRALRAENSVDFILYAHFAKYRDLPGGSMAGCRRVHGGAHHDRRQVAEEPPDSPVVPDGEHQTPAHGRAERNGQRTG